MNAAEVRLKAPVGALRAFTLHPPTRSAFMVTGHVIEYGRAWVYVGEHPNLLQVSFSDIERIETVAEVAERLRSDEGDGATILFGEPAARNMAQGT